MRFKMAIIAALGVSMVAAPVLPQAAALKLSDGMTC